ncbi:MAG: 23S rRNA (pseudouridine(1915)-N(3))-methyltransferase RlmH [Candidatus Nanoarchaeia archaeon]
MQYLYIYYFGPIKDSSIKTLIYEISKRLKRVKCVDLQSPKAIGREATQLKEKELLEKHVFEKHKFVIVCSEQGREFSTQSLHSYVKKLDSPIAIIISGAYGPHKDVFKKANLSLSLSRFTFTHEMAYYLLLEQCYRLECFENNKEYTK